MVPRDLQVAVGNESSGSGRTWALTRSAYGPGAFSYTVSHKRSCSRYGPVIPLPQQLKLLD